MGDKPQVAISKMPDGRYQVVLEYGNNVKTIWVAATHEAAVKFAGRFV